MDDQEMRPVIGFEGIYSVTRSGKVWSHERTIERKSSSGSTFKTKVGGRWLRLHKSSSYIQVVFSVDGRRSMPMVHRLVAVAFIENKHGYPEVNHKDGNKLNNGAENLEWVTRSMNMKHAWDIGIQKVTPARVAHGSELHHKFAPWRNK